MILPLKGEAIAKRSEGVVLLSRRRLPPHRPDGRLPLQGEDLKGVSPAFAPKGAILTSHGETISGSFSRQANLAMDGLQLGEA